MTKGNSTTTIGLRLPDEFIERVVKPKAESQSCTPTEAVRRFVLKEMPRRHTKQDLEDWPG